MRESSDRLTRSYFKLDPSPVGRRRSVRALLRSALLLAVGVPALFYLRFQTVGWIAVGLTVFLVALCLLAAIGVHFRHRPEFHSPVALKDDWLDRIGAFWLVACAFGPLVGWMLTSLFPLTAANWIWLYSVRLLLAGVLPILTALPLLRYVRGPGAWVGGAILLAVTLLPLSTVWNVGRDLIDGPQPTDAAGWYLPHSGRRLGGA